MIIKALIFKNRVPLLPPRFTDFIDDGLSKLDDGVYIHVWHSGNSHDSELRKYPYAYDVQKFSTNLVGSTLDTYDFTRLGEYAKFAPRLRVAAHKFYFGGSVMGRFADSEYTVSYIQNGVNQIIGVRAGSEEEAKQKFLAYKARKGYDVEFVGVSYGFESKPGFPVIDEAPEENMDFGDAGSGYINLSYKVGNDYKGVLVRANSLSEATAKLHEKYPSAKVLGNYTATPEEVKHLTSMGTPMLDEAIEDGVIRPDGAKFGYHPTGIYSTNGKSYRGFEVTSGENGLRKGVYRFYGYIAPGKVLFGNSAVDGEFRKADFDRLIGEGKIRLLDEDIDLDETHAFGDDVVKSGSGWTNKGKEGTHGQFATKKEAAAQTRAMYANGYKGDSGVATVYAPIVDAFASQEVDREGNSIPVGAKVFIYRGKNSGKVGVVKSWEGNYAVVESGGSTARYVGNEDLIKDSASGLKKLFKVKDQKSGKTYAVSAKDSVEAVAKVSKCLKDATPHEVVVYTNQVLSEMGLNNSLGKYDSVVRRMRGLYGQSFATGDDLKAIIKKALPSVLQYLGFPV